MIFYKEEDYKEMMEHVNHWIKMGMSSYSIFPYNGKRTDDKGKSELVKGYLLNLNLMDI